MSTPLADLEILVKKGALPPVLLFFGPSRKEQMDAALFLAERLMGPSHASKLQKGIHPDLHLYTPEGKSGTHPIDALRQLIAETSLPPFEAPCKIFIIDDAENMQLPSSNALLKTLEEPLFDTYIILLTAEAESLLPTITSRCRKIPFHAASALEPPNELLAALLNALEESLGDPHDETSSELWVKKVDLLFQQIVEFYRSQVAAAVASHDNAKRGTYAETLEKVISRAEESRKAVQSNVRLRTALEHFFS
jgi:DNA polymerase III delta prime subunit